jgi:energy-coupling factor transport system ATP-binding protein
VLAALTAAVVLAGTMLPHAGSLQILGAASLGVLARRHRLRSLVAGAVAVVAVTFLVGGVGSALAAVNCAVGGGLAGVLRRRGRGVATLLACGLLLGAAAAAAVDVLLAVLPVSREAMLTALRASIAGLGAVLSHLPGGALPAALLGRIAAALPAQWPWLIGLAVLLATCYGLLAVWAVLGALLPRLEGVGRARVLASPPEEDAGAAVDPLPVHLTDVRFRHPGTTRDALAGLTMTVEPGEFVVVVGPNGSGKSTLAAVLAGSPVTGGTVHRPGGAGLGRTGGTALVMQRPESQVLGVRVADDLRWGLPPQVPVDVDGLLDLVGLAGAGDRETATLSGGELQRLAIAAALARRPSLLVSDESTAMVDTDGRARLLDLFRQLARRGPAVVHVTHDPAEAAGADRVVHVRAGRVAAPASPPASARTRPEAGRRPSASSGRPLLRLREVSHLFAPGTPWERLALAALDLDLAAGDGLLVVGGNGSGKSTLAWLMAGLRRPTLGTVELEGRPVHRQRGAVGLAFQHARLQLQRPTVGADILDAAGLPRSTGEQARRALVERSLLSVGLDPGFAGRPVDRLSGGQMRRVALAGLLARRPRLLVLDEPLAGLDASGRAELLGVLADLRTRDGVTVVMVSHDLQDADRVCDRLVRLDGGRLVADTPLRAGSPVGGP